MSRTLQFLAGLRNDFAPMRQHQTRILPYERMMLMISAPMMVLPAPVGATSMMRRLCSRVRSNAAMTSTLIWAQFGALMRHPIAIADAAGRHACRCESSP